MAKWPPDFRAFMDDKLKSTKELRDRYARRPRRLSLLEHSYYGGIIDFLEAQIKLDNESE
jgi:hypothetical protein